MEEITTMTVELCEADWKKLEAGEEFVLMNMDVAGRKFQVLISRKKKRKKVDLPQIPQLEEETKTKEDA